MRVDPRLLRRRRFLDPRQIIARPEPCRDDTNRCDAEGHCLKCHAVSGDRRRIADLKKETSCA